MLSPLLSEIAPISAPSNSIVEMDAVGQVLLETFARFGDDPDEDEVETAYGNVRAWLDNAMAMDNMRPSHTWGRLCRIVLMVHSDPSDLSKRMRAMFASLSVLLESENPAVSKAEQLRNADQNRIATYLNTMTDIGKDELFCITREDTQALHPLLRPKYMERPAYEGLRSVLEVLQKGNHNQLLASLLVPSNESVSAWTNPLGLLHRLDEMRGEQMEYVRDMFGNPHLASIDETVQGYLLKTLCSGAGNSAWDPEDSQKCGAMWPYVNTRVFEMEDGKTALIQKLLRSMPNQIGLGLVHLLRNSDVSSAQLEAFFPLSLAGCNNSETLASIVTLLSIPRHMAPLMDSDYIARSVAFEALFQTHHPELCELVKLHIALFTNAACRPDALQTLADRFENSPGLRPVKEAQTPSLTGMFDLG